MNLPKLSSSIFLAAVVCLTSCTNVHESPMSVATAFQNAIQAQDYRTAWSLLSDTCKALAVDSDLEGFFESTPSALQTESSGKLHSVIGDWPRHRLIEFSSTQSLCTLTDHVTVVRENDSWYVVWVDHMARTSVIDPEIDPFNTLCEAHCVGFNYHYNQTGWDKRKYYKGADLSEELPDDRWVAEVRLRESVWDWGKSRPKNYRIIHSAHYDISEHIDVSFDLGQALGNFARQDFLPFVDDFLRFARCTQGPKICFKSKEYDIILQLVAEYFYSIKDNHGELENVYRYFIDSTDDKELRGVETLRELLATHKTSEASIEIALELASMVKETRNVAYLMAKIEKDQKELTSEKIPVGLKPTKLVSNEHKQLCFDTFQAQGSALPEEHLEAFCACAFFGEGNLDELLKNSGEFIRHNEDCVEAHIFQTLEFSSADKERFWSGVDSGTRQYSRTEFAESCANGISQIPRSDAIELCGCVYDRANGNGIRLEDLAGDIGAELGADCAQSLGINL